MPHVCRLPGRAKEEGVGVTGYCEHPSVGVGTELEFWVKATSLLSF